MQQGTLEEVSGDVRESIHEVDLVIANMDEREAASPAESVLAREQDALWVQIRSELVLLRGYYGEALGRLERIVKAMSESNT